MDKKIFSEIKDNIGIVWLNRPEKKNALNDELWFGLPELVKELDENEEVLVIILAAKGDTFSAGIDINLLVEAFDLNEDLRTNAEERIEIMEITKKFQDAFTTVAKTKKPTIAAIQGFSIGGATNLVASCDIRLSTKDAKFSIGESKLGLVADVGALQRMPKIISKGLLRELAYTGKTFGAEYAKEIGFVNHIYETHEELINGAMDLAKDIASNSPLVIKGVKMMLDKGEELTAIIKSISKEEIQLKSQSHIQSEKLKTRICIGQAVPKGKNMDLIIEKSTELGAAEIYPIISERTIIRLNEKEGLKKTEKWQRIAIEACKQSGQNWLPLVNPPQNLKKLEFYMVYQRPRLKQRLKYRYY
mgnify:CR=1 FL=1